MGSRAVKKDGRTVIAQDGGRSSPACPGGDRDRRRRLRPPSGRDRRRRSGRWSCGSDCEGEENRRDRPAFEALLEYLKESAGVRLHRVQAAQPDPADRGSAWARCGTRYAEYSTASRWTLTSSPALQHDPDQRHGLLPGPAGHGTTCATRSSPGSSAKHGDAADPGVVRGVRLGRGALQHRDDPGRGPRPDQLPAAREDLRDRRGRGGARAGADGNYAKAGGGGSGEAPETVLRPTATALRVPKGAPSRP